ncbi:MAG: hypothetical protein KBT76_15535 [Sulfitobacter litoralis]|nr:hypothetical protein [Sulfitobacter litoralis]
MTPAERNRRKRRLEAAGFKALPTGWVPAAYADRVAAQVAAYRKEVDEAAQADMPLGRPPKGLKGA